MHNYAPDSFAAPLLVPEREVAGPAARSRYVRYFFVGMAGVFLLLAALGFTPSYQAVYAGKVTLHWFAHVHGTIMAGWLVLFFTQSLLAARGNLRYHRQLGISAAVFGVLVLVTMATALVRALIAFPPPLGDGLWDIVTLSVGLMFCFALFFGVGVRMRTKPAVHKRLLLLATLVLLQAAIDRTHWLPGLGSVYWMRFVYLDALFIPLFLYDFLTVQRIHRATLLGCGVIGVTQLVITMMLGSPALHQFWFNRLAPYVEPVVEVKLTDEQIAAVLGDYGYPHWHIAIFIYEGKLYFKMPDQDRWEFAAKSETEFFMRTMAWNLSFPKGPDGRVLKVINIQPNQTWELPKMWGESPTER